MIVCDKPRSHSASLLVNRKAISRSISGELLMFHHIEYASINIEYLFAVASAVNVFLLVFPQVRKSYFPILTTACSVEMFTLLFDFFKVNMHCDSHTSVKDTFFKTNFL